MGSPDSQPADTASSGAGRVQPAGIAVLCLGNPILSDDAIGLKIGEALRKLLQAEPVAGVTVLESTRAGFELLDLLTGFSHAIIVDCLDVPAPKPGALRILDAASFTGSARLNNVHELSLANAFQLAERLGVPMPRQVEVYAVEGADTRTLSEELSPEVAAAVEPVARRLLERLRELSAALPPALKYDSEISGPLERAFYPPG